MSRPGGRWLVAAVAIALFAAVSLRPVSAASSRSLVVGSKDFAVNQAVAQVYGQALGAKGLDVAYKDNLGATEIVYPALVNGDIDLYPEYANTFLEAALGGTGSADIDQVMGEIRARLPTEVVAADPAPADDVNAFVVMGKTARKYGLRTVSDLARVASQLTFGGPAECETRDLCLGPRSQQIYALAFKRVEKLDTGGPLTVDALRRGDIQVALLFSASSVIPKGAVILRDDKELQGADHPFVLIRRDRATPKVLRVVDRVSAALTTRAYRALAVGALVDHEDPAELATRFLERNHLPH